MFNRLNEEKKQKKNMQPPFNTGITLLVCKTTHVLGIYHIYQYMYLYIYTCSVQL